MIWSKAKRASAGEAAAYETSGQVGATAQALDQAAASIPSSQRPQLVTPIGETADFRRLGPAHATVGAQRQQAQQQTAASRVGAAGAPPSGNGPGMGGPGGPGNGGPGGPGGGNNPFGHPVPPGAAKKMSEVLGEIVWLMSQSPLHKQFFISGLEWPAAQAAKGKS